VRVQDLPQPFSLNDDLEHPGFGGDSILPRCSGLGGYCLPRYRRMAEPRSDHFPLLFYRTSVQLLRLVAGSARQALRRSLGTSSSGTRFAPRVPRGGARVTHSVIACDAGGALDLGGGSVAPVPRSARRCPDHSRARPIRHTGSCPPRVDRVLPREDRDAGLWPQANRELTLRLPVAPPGEPTSL
jgi:hypothetical protein